MVHRDTFINELNVDSKRAWIIIIVGIALLLYASYRFLTSLHSLQSILKQQTKSNKRMSLLNDMTDASQDNVLAPPPPASDYGVDVAPIFSKTLKSMATNPNVIAFNNQAEYICKARKHNDNRKANSDDECKTDPGLGGGTSYAFDAKYD